MHREYFASAVHGAIVTHLRTEEPCGLTFAAKFARIPDPDCAVTTWAEGTRFGLHGAFPEGVTFAIEGRIAATGGTVEADAGGTLRVHGADAALLVLTIATNYRDAQPGPACAVQLDAVPLDYADAEGGACGRAPAPLRSGGAGGAAQRGSGGVADGPAAAARQSGRR